MGHCRTRFLLIPDKGVLLSFLEMFYERIIPACKITAGFFVFVVFVESTYVIMGGFALTQVYGVNDTISTLTSYEDRAEAILHLQLIFYSLVLTRYLPWQKCLLQFLRRSSRLPLLRAVLPADLPVRFREPPRKRTDWRVLADALLLPVFANIVGTLFFSSVKPPLSRVLIVGGVFLTVECGLFMYLSQKQLRRQHQIQVLPVEVPQVSDA